MTQQQIAAFFFLCALNAVCFSQAALIVNPILDKEVYAPGNTVVVALECIIPDGHHLYGNSLGPGIGKPLELTVDAKNGIFRINLIKRFS